MILPNGTNTEIAIAMARVQLKREFLYYELLKDNNYLEWKNNGLIEIIEVLIDDGWDLTYKELIICAKNLKD